MAKAGTKVTDAEGTIWVATQGGSWRAQNGKYKGKLSKDVGIKGDPVNAGGGASSGGDAGGVAGGNNQVTLANNAPTNLSPEGAEYLKQIRASLDAQKAQGVDPAALDKEYQRRVDQVSKMSPDMQKAALNLQGQVKPDGINQSQAENELYRLQSLENNSSPQVGTDTKLDSASDVINTGYDVAKGNAVQGNTLSNANESGPLGSKTVTIDPLTGQPTVTTKLSEGNEGALKGIQGSSVGASDVLKGLLGNGTFNSAVSGAVNQQGPSNNLIDAIYGHLTEGYGDQKTQEYEDKKQELANRGIPIGSNAYNNEMNRLDLSWRQKEGSARNQAVTSGYNQANTQQQNNISGLGTLSGSLGNLSNIGVAGWQAPAFQGFQATQVQQPDVNSIFGTLTGQKIAEGQNQTEIEKQKIASGTQASIAAANRAASGGGGGGGGKVKSPFSSSPP